MRLRERKQQLCRLHIIVLRVAAKAQGISGLHSHFPCSEVVFSWLENGTVCANPNGVEGDGVMTFSA